METSIVPTTFVILIRSNRKCLSIVRTCLAVVSAANDNANQGILTVRKVDPEGDRTLGIITKPNRLSSGSGSEIAFIRLSRNEDMFFKFGWYVLENRSYEEGSNSFKQRNVSEVSYFRQSHFSTLRRDCVGISSQRDRLSELLFNHVKQAFPKLRKDLEEALTDSQLLLEDIRDRRATLQEPRAVIQYKNFQSSNLLRTLDYKYHISKQEEAKANGEAAKADIISTTAPLPPIQLSEPRAMDWVRRVLVRTRGKEPPGNFNPLLIGELFWEQSSIWQQMAEHHVEVVADVCNQFLDALLRGRCLKDVYTCLWTSKIEDTLKLSLDGSTREMEKIREDIKSYWITYDQ
ncbi:MAG: hypothetical protein M1827_006728 [Pycnora praestabilis]|nr:MAG: hypothetical protein M1827_006728 [Pycnora praestabilis]